MNTIQALILGAFQGIAEFLPISSSGHLLVFKDLMGLSEVPALFDVILHVATLASVIVVFRKRIWAILVSIARWLGRKAGAEDAGNLAIVVPAIIATAVTAGLGFAVDAIDLSARPKIVSGLFLVTAAILIASRWFKGATPAAGMRWYHGLAVGVAQGIGVFPGISRSGITITAGQASGLDREAAGEFAFLISIPAILGALILEAKDAFELAGSVAPATVAAGALVAFAVGIVALKLLMPLVRKGKLAWFAVYLIPAGIIGMFVL